MQISKINNKFENVFLGSYYFQFVAPNRALIKLCIYEKSFILDGEPLRMSMCCKSTRRDFNDSQPSVVLGFCLLSICIISIHSLLTNAFILLIRVIIYLMAQL